MTWRLWCLLIVFTLAAGACSTATTAPVSTGAPAEPTASDAVAVDADADIDGESEGDEADPVDTAAALRRAERVDEAAIVDALEPTSCFDFGLDFSFGDVVAADFSCSLLRVLADRDDPEGRQYELAVVQLESESDDPRPDPVVYLSGGPGAGAIDEVPYLYDDYFAGLLAERDVYIVDQRGTGWSDPYIGCFSVLSPVVNESWDTDRGLPGSAIEEIAECRDAARSDADLRTIGSAQTAADLDELRIALEIEEWNLLGISHGTRVAMRTADLFPDGVRSVILDSVDPPEVNAFARLPRTVEDAIVEVLSLCAAVPACDAEYPDVASQLPEVLADLDQNALFFDTLSDRLTGARFLDIAFSLMYDRETASALPAIVSELAERETETLSFVLETEGLGFGSFSAGVYIVHICREDVPFTTADTLAAGATDDPAYDRIDGYLYLGLWAADVCEILGVEPDATAGQPIDTDVPMLVLAGAFDPITSPDVAAELVANQPSATLVEVPNTGHATLINNPCVADYVADFLDDFEIDPAADCLDDIERPQFVASPPGDVTLGLATYFVDDFSSFDVIRIDAPTGWDRQDLFSSVSWTREGGAPGFAEISVSVQDLFSFDDGSDFGSIESEWDWRVGGTPEIGSIDLGGRTWELATGESDGVAAVMLHHTTDDAGIITVLLRTRPGLVDDFRPVLEDMAASLRYTVNGNFTG